MIELDYYDAAGLSAAFYDVLSNAFPFQGDIAFYASLADRPDGSFLELACGTARVAIELAKLGHQVVGIDLAEAMMMRAVMKCRALPQDVGQRIALVRGDMTDLSIDRRFDAVLIPFYGFAHLADADARGRTVGVIAKHLRKGGRAAIHLPDLRAFDEPIKPNELMVTYTEAGDRARVRAVERSFDRRSGVFRQIMEYTLIAPSGEETRSSREALVYHHIGQAEIERHAQAHGLRVSRASRPFQGPQGDEFVYLLD